jgi:hypothetical protein
MAEEYLKAICFDRTTIEKAMTAAKNSAQDLDPKQHQASQLRIDRALNQWSADKRSQALLILKSTKLENGFLRCSASCARLFNAPAYTPPHRIVLGWFCDYFKNSSVHQVALDLYGQLLSNAPPKTFDIDSSYQPSVELESLLKLLEGQILYQLRHTPVYCFVDSINAYDEDEGKRSKLSSLLKTLATIVETRSPYPFKLLITTSYPCCAEDTVESPKCLVVWDDET